MHLSFFYTMVEMSKRAKNSNEGGPALRQAWTDQKRDFWRRWISNLFVPKCSLKLGDLVFQVSALFFDWKWKRKERKERSFSSTRRPRLRLFYLTRNRYTCQITRESRVAVAHVVTPCTWLYDLGSLTSKRKRCSLLNMLLVKLSSPGLGLVVVVALSLMTTSLQRSLSCSSSVSRACASFPTTRTEIQRAGFVVRLKEHAAKQPFFPIMVRLDHQNLKTLSIRVEPTRCSHTE